MSLTHCIWMQTRSDDLAFDVPLGVINDELASTGFCEYHGDEADGSNDFLHLATTADTRRWDVKVDDIMFINKREDDNPSPAVETWGLFDEAAAQIIANHITAGFVVFREDVEGNHPIYYKMSPGKGEIVQPRF